jgi:hypothetical protein
MGEDIILDEMDKWGRELSRGKGLPGRFFKEAPSQDQGQKLDLGKKSNKPKCKKIITGE